MSIAEYLGAILRGWLLIVILTVVGAITGYVLASASTESYRSTGALLVTSDRGDSTSELVQGSAYVQNLVSTYVLLASSEVVLQPVIDDLDLATTPRSLASTITASSPLNSVIIEISASSASPELAQAIAAGVIESLSEVVTTRVAPTDSDGNPTVRLTVIENPNEPRFPYAPSTRNYVLLAALAGAILGIALSLVRALVWQTIRDKSDIDAVTTVPVIGEVIESKRESTLPAAVLNDPLGVEAESLRSVAANLSFLKVDGGLRSFVITSAAPSEGKSSLATSLALMLAESAKRVLLIDADLRSPSVASYTQLDGGVGLTNVLIGEISLGDAVQRWGSENLDVLTSGSSAPNPGQLLASEAMAGLLDHAREHFDFVIVDSAPLLAVTDAKWLSSRTDGAILAIRHDKTTLRSFERVVDTAETGGMSLLGVVLTRVPRRGFGRYGSKAYGVDRSAAKTSRVRTRKTVEKSDSVQ